jgi:mannitol operon transcriptional antiterminator
VEKLGPYIAIAPRIAIPHARPEQGVNRSGMSLLTLKEPVPFGDKPVQLLIVLAAADSDSHIGALAELTELISDEDNVETMISAQSSEIIASLIERLFEN